MPGSIRVSVLEAFDLPATIADGEDVAIKVAVGTREYQTEPSKAIGGKTMPWSLDYVFPVLNLRDNLVVVLLDENGEAISKNEIDTPSIVEKGSFDVDLLLNGGGNVHLSLSFVLTDEERRRIDVMRAAALKRREQEASKLSASMQLEPVEGAIVNRSSELHSAPVGSLEKDTEKATVAKDSPISQESGGAWESYTNSSDWGDKSDKSTSLGSGNQEPIGIMYSAASDNNSQVVADQMAVRSVDTIGPFAINETKSESQESGDLDRSHLPQTASEELLEELPDANAKATPSSVKAKIKAFENTRPQGATKQSHILPSSSKTQKFSPNSKSILQTKFEDEAEEVAITKEPSYDKETRNEQPEPANNMEGVEPSKSLMKGNSASLEASEAEFTATKEEEHLYEIPPRRREDRLQSAGRMDYVKPDDRNLEVAGTSMTAQKPLVCNVPAQSVDAIGIRDGRLEYQAAGSEQLKDDEMKTSSMQENRHINLMVLSKQVLSGAVSGAVIIAAGALLWAANPIRRNSSLQQRSKQRKRK